MALNDRKKDREHFAFGRGQGRNFAICDPVKSRSRDRDRDRALTAVVLTLITRKSTFLVNHSINRILIIETLR